uniref:C3H1-type domain-containing protein n=1 Tax=Neobodo designis TaxID=312471 RepID=A0A7S1M9A8_NEODS|eukprot:CAMPEP_0174847916 /NCGR_PEP_ID=MMETSP1114-20130205/13205_1 /TAXON_ID=312471 /ORGANISM="Neobodo designis, Strain CCAP 1951/1" /LENGTH=354 /DNA_ID=CAMNT_0016082205 /DNA_START=31 /DNA_END=1095 /DNA_ORIENTATION=+
MPAANGRVCVDFLGNKCSYGDDCKFVHDKNLCRFAWRGDCKRGDACNFSHDFPANILKLKPKNAAPAAAAPAAQKNNSNGANAQVPRPKRSGNTKPAKAERDAASDDDDEYGAPAAKGANKKGRKAKNTESFDPSHAPPDMRVVVDPAAKKMSIRPTVRDVTLHPNLFTQPGDEHLYAKLTAEVEAYERANKGRRDVLKLWHGDSHFIADDSTGWKKQSPTFNAVIERIKTYFNMNVQATRFNWYKDQSEWKPFHHDAAAVKPEMAKKQNFTVGISFGCTRDAAFEEAQSKKVISFPLTDGSTYCFARDTNVLWRHGILQVPPGQQKKEGRISVIAWGWVDQDEVNAPPAKLRK